MKTGDEVLYAEVYDCAVDGEAHIELPTDYLKNDGSVENGEFRMHCNV